MRFLLGILILFAPLDAWGQSEIVRKDTLQLETVRKMAAQRDPRSLQPQLLAVASQLKLENLRAQRLPQLSISAQATIQNEVPTINFGSMGVAGPPLDQYRVQAEVDWLLFSGGRLQREATAELARLDENLAGVSTMLHALREGATETYFAILLFQARADALYLAAEDLRARLVLVQTQVRDSVALPADAAALEAEFIQLNQQVDEAEASRQAAMAVLSGLINLEIPSNTVLALPELSEMVATAPVPQNVPNEAELTKITTPDLERLMYRQNRLEAESRVVSTRLLPQVSVFGQAGLGRPGPFNFLSDKVNEFGLAGVRLRWSILDWGQTRRNAQLLKQQSAITAQDADAVRRRIVRDIQDDQAVILRLMNTIADDERLLALREQVLEVARHQLEEGVLLPAHYADRVTDLASARLTAQRHNIELALAEARLLSALGSFPDESLTDSATLKESIK